MDVNISVLLLPGVYTVEGAGGGSRHSGLSFQHGCLWRQRSVQLLSAHLGTTGHIQVRHYSLAADPSDRYTALYEVNIECHIAGFTGSGWEP